MGIGGSGEAEESGNDFSVITLDMPGEFLLQDFTQDVPQDLIMRLFSDKRPTKMEVTRLLQRAVHEHSYIEGRVLREELTEMHMLPEFSRPTDQLIGRLDEYLRRYPVTASRSPDLVRCEAYLGEFDGKSIGYSLDEMLFKVTLPLVKGMLIPKDKLNLKEIKVTLYDSPYTDDQIDLVCSSAYLVLENKSDVKDLPPAEIGSSVYSAAIDVVNALKRDWTVAYNTRYAETVLFQKQVNRPLLYGRFHDA
jgi:hypothetical protein